MFFTIFTLGCKVNQYESQVMNEKLTEYGYQSVSAKEKADIYIINSCTVTATSDSKALKLLRRTRRQHQNSIIVLTGCMPQVSANVDVRFIEADIILGNKCRADLIPSIEEFISNRNQIIKIKEHKEDISFENMAVHNFNEHTRAFVKIEDGCNRFCSYCIIPYARGRVRSKKLKDIKAELENLASVGYKEVVLVGINLSAYGEEYNLNLADAIETACEIKGITRVRLGSIEPERMDKDIISRLAKQRKLCPQFHLSLQSGCDKTLKRMNRHYDTETYRGIVNNLRNAFNNTSITTDIMVGFPGETEEEFQESLNFADEIGFEKVHVFSYSRRPGTVADTAQNQVPKNIKDIRSKLMIDKTAKRRKDFLYSQINKCCNVLVETFHDNKYYVGYTENYTPVRIYTLEKLEQIEYSVIIKSAEEDYCVGEIIKL